MVSNISKFASLATALIVGAPAWAISLAPQQAGSPHAPQRAASTLQSTTLALGNPCNSAPDDGFEDNDDCASAVVLPLGNHPNLHVKANDLDYYTLSVPGQSSLTVTLSSTNGDVWMTGFSPCFYQITGTSSTSFTLPNASTGPFSFVLEVRPNGVDCADYDLDLTANADPCIGVADDAFENNDDCASAVNLLPGQYDNLVAFNGDGDYFRIAVAAGDRLELIETADSYSACYTLWTSDCVTRVADDLAVLDYTNVTGQNQEYILEVSNCFQSIPSCSTYGFDLMVSPSPCLQVSDDAFEPNDDCTEALSIQDGTYAGLEVSAWSPDLYSFCVPAGSTFDASIAFSDALGDLDLYLFDLHDSLCGILSPGTDLIASRSHTDNEGFSWYNSYGTAKDVVLLVVVDEAEDDPCNTYDLTVSGGADCVGALVTYYCNPMNPNSTGNSTFMIAGHGWSAQTGLRLQAILGPPNQFAYFLVGTGASSPGLSLGDGRLCLRTSAPNLIGRYNVAGTNQNSLGQFDGQGIFQNLSGTASLGSGFDVPPTLPFPGNPTIQLGETYFFQLWHRDGTGSSNFSNAAAVRF